MAKIDKEKMREWMDEKKEHLKDYVNPYTEKLQPMVDDIKYRADPMTDKIKEKTAPMAERAKEHMAVGAEMAKAGAEKAKAGIEAAKVEMDRVAEKRAAEKAARLAKKENMNDSNEANPNKKLVMLIGVVVIVVVAFIIGVVLGGRNTDDVTTDPTEIVGKTIGKVDENEDQIAPTEPLRLANEANRPTFTINDVEYEFGCELGELLNNGLEIAEIDVYLHYNKKALIVPAGWTRDWEIEDALGRRLNVTIVNDTKEELSSESCKVAIIEFNGSDDEIDMSLVSEQIKIGMRAKDIVDILGSVSGSKELDNTKMHWWKWRPYENGDQQIYIRVNTNEDGNVVAIRFETPSK